MIISKKQLIGVVAIGILLAGVVFFIWWVSKGRFIQTTDDAYIGGNITTVTSKVSGYISAIEVRDNQSVKKGDIILRLDDRDYRANVARLEAKIKSSKANLESIQATIAMQQSIIQSASETWQAVKHEEQKRLRDTERYENSHNQRQYRNKLLITPGLTTSRSQQRSAKPRTISWWRSNGWQFYLLRKKTYVQVSKKFRPL